MEYITETIDGKKVNISIYEKKRQIMRDIDLLKYYYPNKKREIKSLKMKLQLINKLYK